MNGDECSSRARYLGSNNIVMAIVQKEEIAIYDELGKIS